MYYGIVGETSHDIIYIFISVSVDVHTFDRKFWKRYGIFTIYLCMNQPLIAVVIACETLGVFHAAFSVLILFCTT